MPPVLVTTPYGEPAVRALHAQLVAAKRDDPLAPVAVVVPTNSVSVATRRRLAAGDLGPMTARGRGVVGVSFVTVLRLAELLAAPVLAGQRRRPVSTPVVAAAVRHVLEGAAGMFAPVRTHPATEEALVAAHRELADLDAAALDVLAAQSPRARDVVRIHRAVSARLAAAWYAEHDLMDAATVVVTQRAPLPGDLRALVVYLPQLISVPAGRLLRALSSRVDTAVVLGCTGHPRADAAVVAGAGRLGLKVADDAFADVHPAVGTSVVSASDPDDEVRAVVRGVVDAMREGVALERMAVCYASPEPYARLLHEHLELAGIAHNGASVRALVDCVFGRALLRLLALPDEGFRRDEFFAFLASAPVLDGGRRAPAALWERVSRQAGVVAGIGEWRARLDRLVEELEGHEQAARERAGAESLRSFVAGLAAELDPSHVPARWSAKCRWAHALIRRYLGDERRRDGWPAFEQEAARRVEMVLDRLAGLDEVEAAPSLDVFRRTLELELTTARDRVGRLGEGMLVGPVQLTLGADLERLFVCGLAEGVFPAIARDDPLLGDAERAALGGELPLRAERLDDDHRALLAALASTSGERVLSFGRGDLRRSTERVPSRFLLDTVAALSGRRELSGNESWCTHVASYLDGLARAPFPATRHEHDLRTVLSGAPLAAPELERGIELLAARRSDAFTRFDGNLAPLASRLAASGPTAAGTVVSPTRLEAWAKCPHAYFVRYVLGVQPVERPEEIMQITPLDRGSLVHEVLDRFVTEGDAAGRARLHEIVDEACARVERRGLAGRRLLWERDRRLLHAEMDAWLDADAGYRADHGLTTIATEFRIDDVAVALSDGRTVHLRGVADRIDRAASGNLVVFDYKTGSPNYYSGLSGEDPVAFGTRLQLPVYAYAARAEFGIERDAVVEAHYWFVGRGDNQWIGYEVDRGVDTLFEAALRSIVEGIEAGCYPAHPSPPGPSPFIDCVYCNPDGLGTAERWREWERKLGAPALAGYLTLAGLRDEDGDGDGDGGP